MRTTQIRKLIKLVVESNRKKYPAVCVPLNFFTDEENLIRVLVSFDKDKMLDLVLKMIRASHR